MFVRRDDAVRAGHPDMIVLARSPDRPDHVGRHARWPAWGVQGHPEVSAAQAQGWFETSRARLEADGAEARGARGCRGRHDAGQFHAPRLGRRGGRRRAVVRAREYAARLVRVQAALRAHGLDALIAFQPESATWLTGFFTRGYSTYQLAIAPAQGEPAVFCREVAQTRRSAISPSGQITPVGCCARPACR
jgi:hypothetical protein